MGNVDILGFVLVELDEDEECGIFENSQMDIINIMVGLLLIDDEGYFGFVVEKLDNLYGVFGYYYYYEEEYEEGEEEGYEEEEYEEEGICLDVDMI